MRQSIARGLLEEMRREYPALIAQETMVIEELIRIAVTWEEVRELTTPCLLVALLLMAVAS